MASFGETLKAKRGPLPTWGWALLLVVVLFVVFKMRAKKTAASSDNTADGTDSSSSTGSDSGAVAGTASSTTTPAAFAMPYSGGDTFINNQIPPATTTPVVTTQPVTPAPAPAKPAPVKQQSYITAKGDTWDSIGKKLNVAPILLWETNGAPAGNPLPGKSLTVTGLIGNPDDVYANQNKIVQAEQAIAKSGKPAPPKQGTLV